MTWRCKIFVAVLFYFAAEVSAQEYPSLAPFINEIIDDVDGDSGEVIPEIELSTECNLTAKPHTNVILFLQFRRAPDSCQ